MDINELYVRLNDKCKQNGFTPLDKEQFTIELTLMQAKDLLDIQDNNVTVVS
jgi:hypothetical protein